MTNCTSCGGAGVDTKTVPAYRADLLGAPFEVVLRDAVKQDICTKCRAVLNTAIPDPDGLVYAVVVTRALHPRKMTGAEIRFIRQAMKWKSKELAAELGVSPEHLSRCENGAVPMSETLERLFRLSSILRDRSMVDKFIEKGFKNFRIAPSWDADDRLAFCFERRKAAEVEVEADAERAGDDDASGGKWEPDQETAAAA